jgi:hypothetical protein
VLRAVALPPADAVIHHACYTEKAPLLEPQALARMQGTDRLGYSQLLLLLRMTRAMWCCSDARRGGEGSAARERVARAGSQAASGATDAGAFEQTLFAQVARLFWTQFMGNATAAQSRKVCEQAHRMDWQLGWLFSPILRPLAWTADQCRSFLRCVVGSITVPLLFVQSALSTWA